MTDAVFVARPDDLTRVNTCLRSDMRYWTRVLGVSDKVLLKVVMSVGVDSWAVRAEIRRLRRK